MVMMSQEHSLSNLTYLGPQALTPDRSYLRWDNPTWKTSSDTYRNSYFGEGYTVSFRNIRDMTHMCHRTRIFASRAYRPD